MMSQRDKRHPQSISLQGHLTVGQLANTATSSTTPPRRRTHPHQHQRQKTRWKHAARQNSASPSHRRHLRGSHQHSGAHSISMTTTSTDRPFSSKTEDNRLSSGRLRSAREVIFSPQKQRDKPYTMKSRLVRCHEKT